MIDVGEYFQQEPVEAIVNKSLIEVPVESKSHAVTKIDIQELTKNINPLIVRELLVGADFKPEQLLTLLSQDPRLKQFLDSPAQVQEGYNIREHTAMAGKQYEKYFADRLRSPTINGNPLDIGFMRFFIAIHDMGKALSIEATGKKFDQGKYGEVLVPQLMEWMGYSHQEVSLAQVLVNQDWVGNFITSIGINPKGKAEKISAEIQSKAKLIGVGTKELYEIAKMYYMIDAGSYTANAGGIPSLDRIFTFGEDTMDFSFKLKKHINALDERIESSCRE